MKMKERFHAVCRFLTMVSQGNHRVLFWLIGSAFAAGKIYIDVSQLPIQGTASHNG